MLGLTVPASEVLFKVGDPPPADDLAWESVAANAVMLGESAHMLLSGSRRIELPEWIAQAEALARASRLAAEAAQKKDVDGVLEAGDAIYQSCDGCHQKFMPARQAENAPVAN